MWSPQRPRPEDWLEAWGGSWEARGLVVVGHPVVGRAPHGEHAVSPGDACRVEWAQARLRAVLDHGRRACALLDLAPGQPMAQAITLILRGAIFPRALHVLTSHFTATLAPTVEGFRHRFP